MELMNPVDKLAWIKELVRAEQQMEESGVVEFDAGFDLQQMLAQQSVSYLNVLKSSFVDAASSFNQMKGSTVGRVKIYGISNTEADFMLFRNGLKLIFSLKEPGVISLRFNFVGSPMTTSASNESGSGAISSSGGDEEFLLARWGAFGDISWTYKDHAIRNDFLVRYYLTRFIRDSAK
jgi:hypothetical protein